MKGAAGDSRLPSRLSRNTLCGSTPFREVYKEDWNSSMDVKSVKAVPQQEFPQKFELYGQQELRIGSGQGFSSSKCGLTALQKGFDAIG